MKNIKTYTPEQLQNLRASGKILIATHKLIAENIRAGVSCADLDKIAEDFIRSQNAEPSFKGHGSYKHSICASVNNESVHGIPTADKVLKEGDIVSIDIGVRAGGMCTDAARTYPVGQISPDAQQLIDITRECFFVAIKGLKAKSKVGDIGDRIQTYIETMREKKKHCPKEQPTFGIVNTYFGHGVGEKVHEEPLIPHFKPDKRAKKIVKDVCRVRLPAGCVIAIEPMINAGSPELKTAPDGWTAITVDGSLAAHYENTVIILEDGVEIVTLD